MAQPVMSKGLWRHKGTKMQPKKLWIRDNKEMVKVGRKTLQPTPNHTVRTYKPAKKKNTAPIIKKTYTSNQARTQNI